MRYFVTAIGTDSGKTLVSAIITEALKADYWKPIQSGTPRDTEVVSSLVSNNESAFYREAYLLNKPASPHDAAKEEGITINKANMEVPGSGRDMVIEGAGGIMVPLNDNDLMIDLADLFEAEVILVSNLYLGSINHTLLSAETLIRRGYHVKGIIFNGESNPESERIILKHTQFPCLLRLPKLDKVDKGTVKYYAEKLLKNWYAGELVEER
ncbi:dethiobiotin synthase [Roseivirga sp. BDSF3-8]|uniref:dethiobiotin synthase n=1 Tax=Roseivirga sp. BDSF3-8 TaxID=3241598 RepID=UPI0035319B50